MVTYTAEAEMEISSVLLILLSHLEKNNIFIKYNIYVVSNIIDICMSVSIEPADTSCVKEIKKLTGSIGLCAPPLVSLIRCYGGTHRMTEPPRVQR